MAELAPGTIFAGCRIEAVAGRGGMGIVYRATQLDLGRPVAIKLLATQHAEDPEFRRRFEREARLTAAIDHPNVIPIHAAGEQDGHLYLVMRYVAGTDLHALLRERTRLAPLRASVIVAQVADGLDAAHAAGLVHRDVKPANVLIAGRHVYLSDFGITRDQMDDTVITDSGAWIGTVDFMSPEHLDAQPTDARSDVYALGCVLCCALTGTPPFHRGTVPATIAAHMREPAPRPSELADVPEAFDAIVARALAKDPAERYASAGELGRAALAAAGVAATRTSESTGGAALVSSSTASENGDDTTHRLEAPAVVVDPPPHTAPTHHAPSTVIQAPGGNGSGDEVHPRARAGARRRRPLIALAVLGVLLAAGAGAVLGLDPFADGDETPAGPLRRAEVERVANAFSRAYARENSSDLRRLLTPNVRRVAPDSTQDGRTEVVAEYRRQFVDYRVQDYQLRGLTTNGGAVGRAASRYLVLRRDRPTISGRLVLGVVRVEGKPRIELIAAEPRG